MREGDNPLADLICFLVPLSELPRKNREALNEEDIDLFFSLTKEWFDAKPSPLSATTLSALQRYLGYDEAAQITIKKGLEKYKKDASLRLLNLDFLLEEEGFDAVQTEMELLGEMPLTGGQFTYLGDYRLDCADEEGAILSFKKALKVGGTISACRTLATLYSEKGEGDLAARALEDAGNIAGKDKELWIAIGRVWLEAKNWKRAESAFRYCEEIHAPIEPSDWGLCQALIPQGKWQHALRILRRLQEWDPENENYVLLETEILLERNPEKGERRLRELARLGTRSPDIYLLLSDLSERKGEFNQALSFLDDGLSKVDDDSVESKATLLAAKSKVLRRNSKYELSVELAGKALDLSQHLDIVFNHICADLKAEPKSAVDHFYEEKNWDFYAQVEFLEQLGLYQLWEDYDLLRKKIQASENEEGKQETLPILKTLDSLKKISKGEAVQLEQFPPFSWDLRVMENIHEKLSMREGQQFEPFLDALFDSLN